MPSPICDGNRHPGADRADAAVPRRRWQFSLRRVGVVVAVLCAMLAVGVRFRERDREERRIAARLIALGARVDSDPYGPRWLRRLLGENTPCHITRIFCHDKAITDVHLAELRALTALRELEIYNAPGVTDRGLEEIAAISTLENLVVVSPAITDRGVAGLEALTNLRHLWLPAHISDEAIAGLGKLTNLETLVYATPTAAQENIVWELTNKTDFDFSQQPLADVLSYLHARHEIPIDTYELMQARLPSDTRVSGESRDVRLAHALRVMLEPFNLVYRVGSDRLVITTREALAPVQPRLANLRRRFPYSTEIIVDWSVPPLQPVIRSDDERAIETLASLGAELFIATPGHLRSINLGGAKVNDAVIKAVARFKELTWLDLSRTSVTNENLSLLRGLERLQFLNLSETAVDDEGIKSLPEMLPALAWVSVDGTKVRNAAIVTLQRR
ncbi:MAG TPA: hypothetical protein VF278_03620, partial [Pirellulales bacterium]